MATFFSGCSKVKKVKINKEIKNEGNADNYRKQKYLFGKVKLLKVINYKAIEKFGKITYGPIKENHTVFINNKGEIIETTIYDSLGIYEEKFLSKYDTRGNKIEYNIYNKYNKLKSKITYHYDKKDNLLERSRYNSDGSLSEKTHYVYDTRNNKIEENVFNSKSGNKSTFIYDKKNRIIKSNVYNSSDKLISNFKYDKQGRKIEMYKQYTLKNVLFQDGINIYDKKGNEIENDYYNNKILESKRIYKYNNNGQISEDETYNLDGSFYGKITYYYDDFGNLTKRKEFVKGNVLFKEKTDIIEHHYEYDNNNNWTKDIFYENKIPIEITEREIEYYK